MGRQLQLVRAVVGTLGCSKGRTSFLRSGLTRHSAKQVLETRLGHGTFPSRAWVESLVSARRLGKVHSTGKDGRKEGRGERWRREQMRRHHRQAEGRDPPALSPSPPTTCALVAQTVRNLPAMQETWFEPWVGKIPRRREMLPTPVFLPEDFYG